WEEHSLNRNYRTDRRLLDCFHYIFSDMGTEKLLPYEEEKDRLRSRVKKEYEDDELIEKIDIHSKKKEGFYDDLFKAVNVQIEKLTRLNRIQKLSPEEQTIAILVRYNWQISNIVKEAEKADINIKVTEGGDLYRIPSTFDLYR